MGLSPSQDLSQPFPTAFPSLCGPDRSGIFVREQTNENTKVYYKYDTENGVEGMEWYWSPYPDQSYWTHIKQHTVAGGKLDGTAIPENKGFIKFLENAPIPPHVMSGTLTTLYTELAELLADDPKLGNRKDLLCYYAQKEKPDAAINCIMHPALIIFTSENIPSKPCDVVYVLHLVKNRNNITQIKLEPKFWKKYKDGNPYGWQCFTDDMRTFPKTLTECAKWCLLYQNKHPGYSLTDDNCRKFMIKLCAYLSIVPFPYHSKFRIRAEEIFFDHTGCTTM